ncbi:MAG: maltose alpha-D-glucosyltransferase, partial [Terriglobia bacterium]
TAELHIALASDSHDPCFAPEPFSLPYQRTVYEAMVEQADRAFRTLRSRHHDLSAADRELAGRVASLESKVREQLATMLGRELGAVRTRVHGDYHLGQVLCANADFVIIDFEGEPARPIRERRSKCSPLKDVAGMLRSFHYAAEAALLAHATNGAAQPKTQPALKSWAHYWRVYVAAAFLSEYLSFADKASLSPRSRGDLQILLQTYQLEKTTYELEYELNNRPDWVRIPLQGILQIMEERW